MCQGGGLFVSRNSGLPASGTGAGKGCSMCKQVNVRRLLEGRPEAVLLDQPGARKGMTPTYSQAARRMCRLVCKAAHSVIPTP